VSLEITTIFEQKEDFHYGDEAWLVINIEYACPIEKFWDDDLKELLASSEFESRLYESRTQMNSPHPIDQFEANWDTILEIFKNPNAWKLIRHFGSPDFHWEREFVLDIEPEKF
jgi:hypothetical protein